MKAEEKIVITRSAEETKSLGEELGHQLQAGDVVAFCGELGSGKTCMIQGVCQGLKVADYVTSPTFILINEYVGQLEGRPIPVYHFDLYRLRDSSELEELGAEEYFYSRGICLIEWAERAGNLLPPRRWEVRLEYLSAEERRIALRALRP